MFVSVEARVDVDDIMSAMSHSEKQKMLQRLIENMATDDLREVVKRCNHKSRESLGWQPGETLQEQEFYGAINRLKEKYISLSPAFIDTVLKHAKEV